MVRLCSVGYARSGHFLGRTSQLYNIASAVCQHLVLPWLTLLDITLTAIALPTNLLCSHVTESAMALRTPKTPSHPIGLTLL